MPFNILYIKTSGYINAIIVISSLSSMQYKVNPIVVHYLNHNNQAIMSLLFSLSGDKSHWQLNGPSLEVATEGFEDNFTMSRIFSPHIPASMRECSFLTHFILH